MTDTSTVAPPLTQTLELSIDSQIERQRHNSVLLEIEARKRSHGIVVPTLHKDVCDQLRSLGQPVRLFGENLADVRDRLRLTLAKIEIYKERGGEVIEQAEVGAKTGDDVGKVAADEQTTVLYTNASYDLVQARKSIAEFSYPRAQKRLIGEKRRRDAYLRLIDYQFRLSQDEKLREDESFLKQKQNFEAATEEERICSNLYKHCQQLSLEGSQFVDQRPLSAICTYNDSFVVTAAWSGNIQIHCVADLALKSTTKVGHEDRIMSINAYCPSSVNSNVLLASASIDLTAKIWKVQNNQMDTDSEHDSLSELTCLKGHAARLCKVKWHPYGRHVLTTSFDHTWRMWDVETGTELLLQDGHWKETYGIGMHTDGSLCSTTDFAGIVQLWDLRSGKSISHFKGHAKRVLCSEFSPNGYHLATAGDDGTIKVWDLRHRKQLSSVPAHSRLITQIQFVSGANCLASSSFDGTCKIWSTRDWKALSTLRGHEGKVMGIDVVPDRDDNSKVSLVSCGYDKTLKLWQ